MEKQEKKRRFCGLGQLFDQLFGNKRLMMLTIGFAIFAECVQLTTVFLNQLQYERCGWSAAWIGAAHVLSTVMMLLGAASARCAKKFGEWKMGAGLMLLGTVACMLLAFARKGGVSLVCLLTLSLSGALMTPLAETIKNRGQKLHELCVNFLTTVCRFRANCGYNCVLFFCFHCVFFFKFLKGFSRYQIFAVFWQVSFTSENLPTVLTTLLTV
mgnify:CR=1 FL=1